MSKDNNYSNLIKEAINKINGASGELSNIQKKLLKECTSKLSKLRQNLLEQTIQIVLTNESYQRETAEEHIYKACAERNLRSFINFYTILEGFEMTSNAVLAIGDLSQVELSSLTHWIGTIPLEDQKQMIAKYEEIGRELVVLLTIIIENAYNIAKPPVLPEVDITGDSLVPGEITPTGDKALDF